MQSKSLSILYAVLLVGLFVVLSGCGGGGSDTVAMSSGTGAITAKLVWENKTVAKTVAAVPAGVVTVRISVSAGPGKPTIVYKDFLAAAGSGTIDGVPVGSGLTVTASGSNSSGAITHTGSRDNITVSEGSTTDVGTIELLAPLVRINVTPVNPTIAVGATQQFTAMGVYADDTTLDITQSVSWSSSSPSVATIVTGGKATAVAAGTTTISATSGPITGTTSLLVSKILVRINVTPVNPTATVGATQQFIAMAVYADDSTVDITQSVSWSSSSPSVATIATGGSATAVAAGNSTITALFGSVTGTANLTVQSNIVVPTSGSVTGTWQDTSGLGAKGLFSMTINNGTISGSYSGDDSGNITGSIALDGKFVSGAASSGAVVWSGTV